MSKELIRKLESYRKKMDLTYDSLSKEIGVPPNYIFRWKKSHRIIGIYKKIVEDFLKEKSNAPAKIKPFNSSIKKARVVITGIGMLSPFGVGNDVFFKAMENGTSGIKKITLFDTSNFSTQSGGEIQDFDPKEILGKEGLLDLDRATKLLLCATKFALKDSALLIHEDNTHDIGIVVGTTFGSLHSISSFNRDAYTEGPKYVNPSRFPNTVGNSPASRVAIKFHIKGFNATLSTGMCAFSDALDYARDFIHLNKAQTILVGAVEDLSIQTFLGFYKLNQMSQEPRSCPFDKNRSGLIFSEASVVFSVEEYETAKKRKAKIYAEVLSTGSVFDPARFYRHNLKGLGMAQSMEQALNNAHLKPQDIDCIFANANATKDADSIEAKAIEKIFGRQTPVTAIKSMTGETYSASGALSLAAAIGSLEGQYIPPTINIKSKDAECRINLIEKRTVKKIDKIMINTFSPDGANTSFIIGKIK